MKIVFESLDTMLAELHEQRIDEVRVAPATQVEGGERGGGIPRFIFRVIVTAALGEQCWAEWRLWVGRAIGEVGERGLRVPDALSARGTAALAEVRQRLEVAGFRTHGGILTHDTAVMEAFRP